MPVIRRCCANSRKIGRRIKTDPLPVMGGIDRELRNAIQTVGAK